MRDQQTGFQCIILRVLPLVIYRAVNHFFTTPSLSDFSLVSSGKCKDFGTGSGGVLSVSLSARLSVSIIKAIRLKVLNCHYIRFD
jgi:hypothetical protein